MSDQKNQISANPSFGKELVADVISIVREGRESAYAAVNASAIETYWRVGKRIVEEEQKGRLRAEYGTQLLQILSKELTSEFGKGFTDRNLRNFRLFYVQFPDFEIWHTRVANLTWSHFRSLPGRKNFTVSPRKWWNGMDAITGMSGPCTAISWPAWMRWKPKASGWIPSA